MRKIKPTYDLIVAKDISLGEVRWAIEVYDANGDCLKGCVSEAKNFMDIRSMAREAIALHQDIDPDSFWLAFKAIK